MKAKHSDREQGEQSKEPQGLFDRKELMHNMALCSFSDLADLVSAGAGELYGNFHTKEEEDRRVVTKRWEEWSL